jgi:hypothetical protein
LGLPSRTHATSERDGIGGPSGRRGDFVVTAVAGGRLPKRRVLLLVVVALAVSTLAASATAVALSSRSDLSSTRRRVDGAWVKLRPALDIRYGHLKDAAAAARARLGGRAVFDDIERAVTTTWPGTARRPTERQVAVAADLEGLAARLAATVASTPRLRSADVDSAMQRVQGADTTIAREAYNAAVEAYERARGGFPRRLVAGALGYEERRMLEVPV